MISLLHPSRGRPEKSLETVKKWISRADKSYNLEVIISIDVDDQMKQEYKKIFSQFIVLENANRSAVDAINAAAKVSTGEILIVVSDDTDCPIRWDWLIETFTFGQTDWILKTNDGIQKWIITMPVMDRAYYNRFGYVYFPEYRHMFCDTELTCVADITQRKLKADIVFPHNHYSVTNQKPDEVNKKADATWAQGEQLFIQRAKKNFGLPVGGRIEDNGMIDYIKRKAR